MVSDGPSTDTMGSLVNFWSIPSVPADYNAPDPSVPGQPMGLEPAPGGVKFRFFQIQPNKAFEGIPDDELWEMTRHRFIEMGAEHALVDRTRHAAMHKTETVDFIILLSGQITLLLDEADVVMKPFDVVIQRGTNHAWVNTGDEVATLVAVLVAGG